MLIKYREQVAGAPLPCLAARVEVEAELLPCPMCGVDGEQVLKVMVVCDPWQIDEEKAAGAWAVECGNCGCLLPGWETAGEAVADWNNRREIR